MLLCIRLCPPSPLVIGSGTGLRLAAPPLALLFDDSRSAARKGSGGGVLGRLSIEGGVQRVIFSSHRVYMLDRVRCVCSALMIERILLTSAH